MRNVPHRLVCLNIWTPARGAVAEPLGGWSLPGGHGLVEVGLEG